MTRHRSQLTSRLGARLIVAAWLMGGGAPAWAAAVTYTVNCPADVANSSSSSTSCATAAAVPGCPSPTCTLRAAIQASNAHNGADTINLPGGTYTLTIAGRNENAAARGDLDITDAVTITGAGASSTIINGNGIDRVFDVFANGMTSISGVTIRNGNPGGTCSTTTTQSCLTNTDCPSGQTCRLSAGGGIEAGALVATNTVTLNLSNVIVMQNTSGGGGGGIANGDVLSLMDVTVSNNTCAGNACFGGGVFNMNHGTATLNRVTLSGNTATGGGGLGSDSDCNPTDCGGADALKLTNVTIYGNTADSGAGLEHDNGTATLVNVTISNNTGAEGAGAIFNLGTVTFKYTIVAQDPASDACQPFEANFISGGHNIDTGTSCEPQCATGCPTGTTCTNGLCVGTGDLVNTNPAVAPLANNGGPTFTQALFSGSPALDKGGTDCPPPATDQRGTGFPRPGTGSTKCDIGAFEHQMSDSFPTTTTSTSTTTTSTTTTTTSTTTTRPPTTTSSTTTTTRPPTTTTTTTTTTTRPPTTTTTTTATTTTTMPAVSCGNVNGDTAVNIGDALIVAQYDVGLRTCGVAPFSHPEVCDVNHDGGCNIGDALKIAQCDVGLISCTFTCSPPFSCPP